MNEGINNYYLICFISTFNIIKLRKFIVIILIIYIYFNKNIFKRYYLYKIVDIINRIIIVIIINH